MSSVPAQSPARLIHLRCCVCGLGARAHTAQGHAPRVPLSRCPAHIKKGWGHTERERPRHRPRTALSCININRRCNVYYVRATAGPSKGTTTCIFPVTYELCFPLFSFHVNHKIGGGSIYSLNKPKFESERETLWLLFLRLVDSFQNEISLSRNRYKHCEFVCVWQLFLGRKKRKKTTGLFGLVTDSTGRTTTTRQTHKC